MRKGAQKIRKIKPDLVYGDTIVARLINRSMKDGKRSAAAREVYACLTKIKAETKQEPTVFLSQAIDNIKPKVEVRPKRIGGAVYQVPTPVRPHRQMSLAIRWLVESARTLPNKAYHTYGEKLFAELQNAFNSQGGSVTKRTEVERMAEANKAFAHLKW
jgi:small subunit ribosomal protein S7